MNENEVLTYFLDVTVPRIWRGFKLTFTICFLCIAMMIVFTLPVIPYEWQIHGWEWALIIPLSLVVGCHILLPVSAVTDSSVDEGASKDAYRFYV